MKLVLVDVSKTHLLFRDCAVSYIKADDSDDVNCDKKNIV